LTTVFPVFQAAVAPFAVLYGRTANAATIKRAVPPDYAKRQQYKKCRFGKRLPQLHSASEVAVTDCS
jgi:hypothetical protein